MPLPTEGTVCLYLLNVGRSGFSCPLKRYSLACKAAFKRQGVSLGDALGRSTSLASISGTSGAHIWCKSRRRDMAHECHCCTCSQATCPATYAPPGHDQQESVMTPRHAWQSAVLEKTAREQHQIIVSQQSANAQTPSCLLFVRLTMSACFSMYCSWVSDLP